VLLVWIIFFEMAILLFPPPGCCSIPAGGPSLGLGPSSSVGPCPGALLITNVACCKGNLVGDVPTSSCPLQASPWFLPRLILFAVGALIGPVAVLRHARGCEGRKTSQDRPARDVSRHHGGDHSPVFTLASGANHPSYPTYCVFCWGLISTSIP